MLEIRNLQKTYAGGVEALKSVNLDIDKGMFGLLGPNGAGKSTLMRTIATLQPADSGDIIFAGQSVFEAPDKLRARLGYLPQEFGVYPGMSAEALLDHFAILKGLNDKQTRRDQVAALLQQTNLYEVRKRAVSSFSGGMRQRFGIAQALLGDPELVIVDEPTSGLDPEERNRFHNLLSEIGENVIVLLSTHIVEDVQDLCPRMAILAGGAIVQSGICSELMAELDGRIWQKTVPKAETQNWEAEYQILSRTLYAGQHRLRVLSELIPEDGYEAVSPTLEDVYFQALSSFRLGD
ncbi:MAG: ABC transporter ATP-binding protein [Algicola sp.]|nr:ABC transporter ATP-binding protein [Algicola sp.]